MRPSATFPLRAVAGLLLPLGLLAAGCSGPGDGPETWRFAIEETRGSVQDAYAQRFAELVEERTAGEVDVVVYPYGALGTSDHILEQLHNGTLELAMASPGHLGKLIPEVQVFLLHFALSDDPAVNERALGDPEVVTALRGLYREKGLHFLDVFSEGWMVWTTRDEVRRPEDFAGMKMRVMTSPLLIAAYAAYGAHPTPLPYSEVYSALQLKMIDGQVNPVFAIQEMSFHEVTDWMVFPNHAPFVATVASNPDFVAGLEPERRRMLEEIVRELHRTIWQVQQRYNEERLELIRDGRPELNVVELTDAERAAFEEAADPVRDTFVELAGPRGAELLRLLEEAIERAEAELAPAEGS